MLVYCAKIGIYRINKCVGPSLGSATANDAFFSSLMDSRRLANRGVTFPSTTAATSSKAVAALSNFWKFFNFKLSHHVNMTPQQGGELFSRYDNHDLPLGFGTYRL